MHGTSLCIVLVALWYCLPYGTSCCMVLNKVCYFVIYQRYAETLLKFCENVKNIWLFHLATTSKNGAIYGRANCFDGIIPTSSRYANHGVLHHCCKNKSSKIFGSMEYILYARVHVHIVVKTLKSH